MKQLKKIAIIIGISLISILLLGILLYNFYFAAKLEQYLTVKLQHILEQQFEREVAVGNVQLQLLSPQVLISDVAIARYRSLAEGTWITAKMLKAKVPLRSLVSERIRIDDILLNTPTVWVEFDEQGESNLPSFKKQAEEEPKQPVRFDVGNLIERLYFPHIQIVDAQIHFVHKGFPLTVSVDRLNTTVALSMKDLFFKGKISLDGGSFEFQDRGKMAVALSGEIAFDRDALSLSAFHVNANSSEVVVDGTLHNIGSPRLDLEVKAQLPLEDLDRFLKLDQNLTGMVAFEGTVTDQISDMSVTGHLTCDEGTAWKLSFTDVSSDVTYQQKQVTLANLGINILDGRVTGDAMLSFSETSGYQATLAVKDLNIAQINTSAEADLPLAGRVNGDIEVRGESFAFDDFILHTALTLADVDAYGVKIAQAEAQADIREQTLYIQNLDADVFQGHATANGHMNLSSTPDYEVSLEAQNVELNTIMALIPKPPDVSGRVSGTIKASGAKFDLDSLVLETDLRAENLDAYNVVAKTLNTSAQIQNGILSFSQLSAQLFKGSVTGQGNLVLAGDTLPKFDINANLSDISVRSVMQQFAPTIDSSTIAFDGTISSDVALAGNSYAIQDIKGTVDLKGQGTAKIQEGEVPFDLVLKSAFAESMVNVSLLDVDSAALQLKTSGKVDIASPELMLQYEVASQDIHTMLEQVLMFVPGIGADSPLRQFSGHIEHIRGTVQGPVSDLQIQADVHFTEADLVWVRADELLATLAYQAKTLSINKAKVVYESALVEVDNGFIDLAHPIGVSVELPVSLASGELVDYLAMVNQDLPVEGAVKAIQATISGPLDDLSGNIDVNVEYGMAWGQSFDSLSGSLKLVENQLRVELLTLRKNGGTIALQGFLGFDRSFRAALTVSNIDFHDIDALKNVAVQYQGHAEMTLQAEGTFQNPTGKAEIRFTDLKYNETPTEDVTCDVVMEDGLIRATLVTFRKKFITSFELSLTPEFLYRAEMSMNQAAIEQILSLVASIEGISGIISGKISSEGSLRQLNTVSATVKLSELQLDIFGQNVENNKDIDIVVTPEKFTVNSLELRGKELGLYAQGELDFQGNFDLALDGIVDLRPFLMFLPKSAGITSLDGRVQLICNVRGTFLEPEVEGIAEIQKGSVHLLAYPDPIRNIEGKIAFTKGNIDIIQLGGNVGGGTFGMEGTLSYHGITPDTFNVEIEGKNITIQNLVEALRLTVSPRIRLTGDLKSQKLAGDILVHEALYTKDVDVQTLLPEKSRKISIDTGQKESQLELDIYVRAPKDIQVRNKFARLDMRANLRIQGTPANPQLEGRVELESGKVQFGDITYRILSGVLDFNDPLRLNPEMNIQVETVIQEYTVYLGVVGPLSQFTLDMRSEPELSQAQITRLLAAGSGSGTNGYDVVTKPLQTLVEGQLERAIKLDRFTVDMNSLLASPDGTDAATRVTLGKRLFGDLLLTYTTTVGGTERSQIVEIEYQLSDKLSLTATRNEKGEVDTSFTFKFKLK